jgi:urease subunit gamma/beta
MNLTPTEMERLTLFTAAEFARRHKARGIPLSHPEAVALISDEMMLAARAGMAYEDIVDMACGLLTTDDVIQGVAEMANIISVEASFEEGTKMVIVFDPIRPGKNAPTGEPVPGEIITPDEDIEVNAGRRSVVIDVVNTGDRDIQVRSHAHFFEINRALEFDREKAFGMRLDAPSGVGVRFEPGLRKPVRLVAFGGAGLVFGQSGLTNGDINDGQVREKAFAAARARGFMPPDGPVDGGN